MNADVEPRLDEGSAALDLPGQMLFSALTPTALATLVDRVNAWYDARAL